MGSTTDAARAWFHTARKRRRCSSCRRTKARTARERYARSVDDIVTTGILTVSEARRQSSLLTEQFWAAPPMQHLQRLRGLASAYTDRPSRRGRMTAIRPQHQKCSENVAPSFPDRLRCSDRVDLRAWASRLSHPGAGARSNCLLPQRRESPRMDVRALAEDFGIGSPEVACGIRVSTRAFEADQWIVRKVMSVKFFVFKPAAVVRIPPSPPTRNLN